MSDRTLEHYLQEMGAASMLATLPERTRYRIGMYASKTRTLLELITNETISMPDRLLMTSSTQPTTPKGN